MYQNFHYSRHENIAYIWTDDNGLVKIPYKPYAYIVDPKGEHTTLTGLKVKKVTSWSEEAVKQGLVFEHDVPIATRVLIDNYFESNEPSKNHRILKFDIEVEKGLKYSTAKEAKNRITSIAYHYNGKYVCLLLDEHNRIDEGVRKIKITGTDNIVDVIIKTYDTETALLNGFLSQWNVIKPTLITGWNSDLFDCPYLYNRMVIVLGKNKANQLSPIGVVSTDERGKDAVIRIAGVAQMDYLVLYKKFTYNEESSYALEAISQKELGRGKFKYDGTLDDLYNNNPEGFVEYNVTDVELIEELDKKLDLIEIARGICHLGHVPYDNFPFSSMYHEGAALTYCKLNNLIAIRTKNRGDMGAAVGAVVKKPKSGLYKFIIDEDLTSLYPSLIRTMNISPETIYGYVPDWNEEEWIRKSKDEYHVHFNSSLHDDLMGTAKIPIKIKSTEFWQYLIDNNLCIASNGVIFDKSKTGLIPDILTNWFNERKRLSKLAEEYGIAGDQVQYKYYDRKQLIQKILLNSFYGVLLLPSFRFYDKSIGESITLTGQSVIKFSMKMANSYYNKKIGTKDVDYVVAGDTDSLFLPALPLINLEYNGTDEDELVRRTLVIAGDIQTHINKSYDLYCKHLHNVETHYLNIKQEVIARRAFWGQAKKRYALWIINKKGVPVQEADIKGFDIVRSSFPKLFRSLMKELVNDILHDVDVDNLNRKVRTFKKQYYKSGLFDIMLPTSVKEISKYAKATKGTPIHVKSAQNYNKLLKLHNIEYLPPVSDGDKILYAYVRSNPFGFETMALKGQGEDPPELIEFVEKFIDREKIFNNTFISKLDTIWGDLGWGQVEVNEPTSFF